MPKKVMTLQGVADVPTWRELFEQIGYINQNKQELWNVVNQLKRDPSADIYSEFRALRDAAFSAKEQLNGPIPNDGWHVWKCIEVAGKRLDALESRLGALPEALRETVRNAVRAELESLLGPAVANIGAILEDNRVLRNEIVALRAEVENLKSTTNQPAN